MVSLAQTAAGRAKRVRLIIFDVDGVLTDGGIYIGADGEDRYNSDDIPYEVIDTDSEKDEQ